MSERPYLDYYISNKIIPVRQDISQLESHLKRRSVLYHHLSIPPAAVRSQRVLEIGPGTGDNAIHTASLSPKAYVLVDGNPYSIAATKERLADSRFSFSEIPEIELVECDFFHYHDERRFDLVLCEGIIPGQTEGARFLQHAASFVDIGGLLVITTMSATSVLAEVSRRLLKPVISMRAIGQEDLFGQLQAIFTTHLETLSGRSRVAEDWIRDNILQPWPKSVVFTMNDAIGDRFDVYGTSPQLIQDFRWYKTAAVDGVTMNNVARKQWEKWSAIFIDYRADTDKPPGIDSKELEIECLGILMDAHEAWRIEDLSKVESCVGRIARLGEWICPYLPTTAASIRDFVAGAAALIDGAAFEFPEFKSWFGRGQQYVSFLRIH
jgi:ubiquinone/menaquinone biosynthesis C-methylase UbiE